MKKIISILFFTFIVLQAQASSSACGPGVKMVVSSSENPKKALILVGAAGAIAAVGVIAHKHKIPQKIVVWYKWQKVKIDSKKIIKDFLIADKDAFKKISKLVKDIKKIIDSEVIQEKKVDFINELRKYADKKIKDENKRKRVHVFINTLEIAMGISKKIKAKAKSLKGKVLHIFNKAAMAVALFSLNNLEEI